jgi:hypothetical protein
MNPDNLPELAEDAGKGSENLPAVCALLPTSDSKPSVIRQALQLLE